MFEFFFKVGVNIALALGALLVFLVVLAFNQILTLVSNVVMVLICVWAARVMMMVVGIFS